MIHFLRVNQLNYSETDQTFCILKLTFGYNAQHVLFQIIDSINKYLFFDQTRYLTILFLPISIMLHIKEKKCH